MGQCHRQHRDDGGDAGVPVGVDGSGGGQGLMGARWYNPAAGDFTSRDTVQVPPVPDSAAADPFWYAAGNPLSFTDPTGHYVDPGGSARDNPGYTDQVTYSLAYTAQVWRVGPVRAAKAATAATARVHAVVKATNAQIAAAQKKAQQAKAAKNRAAQQEKEQKAAVAKHAEDALRPADSKCVGPMMKYGACDSERGAAGTTPAQVKQSLIGAGFVLLSLIPGVGELADVSGIGDINSVAADAGGAGDAATTGGADAADAGEQATAGTPGAGRAAALQRREQLLCRDPGRARQRQDGPDLLAQARRQGPRRQHQDRQGPGRDRHRRRGQPRHRPVRPHRQDPPRHRGHPHHRQPPVLGLINTNGLHRISYRKVSILRLPTAASPSPTAAPRPRSATGGCGT